MLSHYFYNVFYEKVPSIKYIWTHHWYFFRINKTGRKRLNQTEDVHVE